MRLQRAARSGRISRSTGAIGGGGGGGGLSLPAASAPPSFFGGAAGSTPTLPWTGLGGRVGGEVAIGVWFNEGGTASSGGAITTGGADAADMEILIDTGLIGGSQRMVVFKALAPLATNPDQSLTLSGTPGLDLIAFHVFSGVQYEHVQIADDNPPNNEFPRSGVAFPQAGFTAGTEPTPTIYPPALAYPANYGYTVLYGATDDGTPVAIETHTAISGGSTSSGSDLSCGNITVEDVALLSNSQGFQFSDLTSGAHLARLSPVIAIPGAA